MKNQKNKRVLNWKPDRPDFRDFKYAAHLEMQAHIAVYPQAVSIKSRMPAIFDQGDLGSCTSQGVGACVDYLELLDLRDKLVGKPEEFDPSTYDAVSRLFIYANERIIEGTPLTEDSGAQIRDGILAVRKYGFCRESLWAYNDTNCYLTPPDPCYAEGLKHKLLYSYSVDNSPGVNQILRSLIHGYPVVFGMSVYESFMSDQVANTGIVPMPQSSEQIVGGHCMVITGLAKNYYEVRNSWGTSWGQEGCCQIPVSMLENSDIATDFWTLRRSP